MTKTHDTSYKEFLNKDDFHSLASIGFFLDVDVKWGVTCVLKVTDCSKVINIDLDAVDFADLENSLHKLDTMIALLKKSRKTLEKKATKALPEIIAYRNRKK